MFDFTPPLPGMRSQTVATLIGDGFVYVVCFRSDHVASAVVYPSDPGIDFVYRLEFEPKRK